MDQNTIKPFLCDSIDKAILRKEWEKWCRAVVLYLDAEDIIHPLKRRDKLLHYGGIQLQEVAYNLPGAIEKYDDKLKNDVFIILTTKLQDYFSPVQNTTFERHQFRHLLPENGETLNKYLLRVRQQANKCSFGTNAMEATEINIKDKLIDNWASVELKKKLLEKERSLDEIAEMCRIQEQIDNQSTTMMGNNNSIQKPETSSDYLVNKISAVDQNKCYRCGRSDHKGYENHCPARKLPCNRCGRIGHFSIKCHSKEKRPSNQNYQHSQYPKRPRKTINYVSNELNETTSRGQDNENMGNFDCFHIHKNEPPNKINENNEIIRCILGGVNLTMLIDSGSKINAISGRDWKLLKEDNAILWNVNGNCENTIKPYASKGLTITKTFESTIRVNEDKEVIANFYVIPEGDTSLIGKNTALQLGILRLGLNINSIEIKPFPKVKGIKVKLTIDDSVKPVQQPLRRIPISAEALVEQKLEEALNIDIIEKVEKPSKWVSPIVVLYRSDGNIRICVDMRRANEAIKRENYPLPTFESFMTKLRNSRYFSRLDLKNAYHQLELDEESREITTFITHKGMFRYKRLLFGVNSAPEIFQRVFENILARCSNTLNYIDDIIVYGENENSHNENLDRVMKTLENNGVLLNKEKCVFKTQKLTFLGHDLSPEGINPSGDKIQTILDFNAPKNKEELRSFLGLITYIGKFIPDLANLTDPLRKLIKKDTKFLWNNMEQQSFISLKKALAQISTLSFFDPQRRTRLIADASPVALGAVLVQFDNQNCPRIISFASKSLSNVERRYSQTEKESLALVWSVEKFYYYLAGLCFELVTDHKPLETIFKPTSKPPARIERWLLRLQAFKFTVIYEPGKYNIADAISRLCKLYPTESFDKEAEYYIHNLIINVIPKAVRATDIFEESRRDQLIQDTIIKINENSWESNSKNPFFPYRFELSTLGPIMLRGNKIIIPEKLRQQTLQLAHEGHPGETVMKRRLRSKVWWPMIDKDAERAVKECNLCILVSRPNNPPPMNRVKFPEGPWQYIALDLMKATPIPGEILAIIDYFSRYQEIKFLQSTTSSDIIKTLKEIFCRLGIPKTMRTDNGRQFTSIEFKNFCNDNNINLIHTAPYWPQANGEIENLNKSILKRLQLSYASDKNYKTHLEEFTLMYNTTPHGTISKKTGKTPTELLFGRTIRDKIPSLADIINVTSPNIGYAEARDSDLLNKEKGKNREDQARKATENYIKIGDKVLIKNLVVPHKLISTFGSTPYTVLNRVGNELILESNGKRLHRHVHHVKPLPKQVLDESAIESSNISSEESSTIEPEPITVRKSMQSTITSDNATNGNSSNITTHLQELSLMVPPLKLKKKEGMWYSENK